MPEIRMTKAVIERALLKASDQQIRSEWGRRMGKLSNTEAATAARRKPTRCPRCNKLCATARETRKSCEQHKTLPDVADRSAA
jgi:hypothetical protein